MKYRIAVSALLFILISCEKDDFPYDINEVKVKSVFPINEGLMIYENSYVVNIIYEGNRISKINSEEYYYNGDKLEKTVYINRDSIFQYDINSGDPYYEPVLQKEIYSYQWSDDKCVQTMDSVIVQVGNNYSFYSGDTRIFYFGPGKRIDSIATLQWGQMPTVVRYVYDNNNITESQTYLYINNSPVLEWEIKYTYTDIVNPFYFLCQQAGGIILPHFKEFNFSRYLPADATYFQYHLDGSEELELYLTMDYVLNGKG